MIQQEYDILLHLLTRHTNLMIPHSDYVNGRTFPAQISELLNTDITLKYRNHYIYDLETLERPAVITRDGNRIPSRPNDDNQDVIPRRYDDSKHYYSDEFTVLRADATEPYRLIAVSKDRSVILVTTSEKDAFGNYKFESIVSEYPVQINDYIGLGVYSQYTGDIRELRAVTLRVDGGEPCNSVLMEFVGSTGEVRFILGDECMHRLYDYYDVDGSRDYNARDSVDYDNPVDVTGEWADADNHGYVFTDVNGGYCNNWDKFYENIMNTREMIDFRKKVLEGINIYGAV